MIPIKNIYYMLAYAFQVLLAGGYKDIENEEFDHLHNLLAAILAKGIANQIKRGLGREYLATVDMLNTPRGKIDISASVKMENHLKKRLVCHYDEYSKNTYINQVLKTIAFLLLRSNDVKMEQKKALQRVLLFFHEVELLNPKKIQWSNIKYHRNNATYRMLIEICKMAQESLLPTEQEGPRRLRQFEEEYMPRLFEKFVLEYYRKHYPKGEPSRTRIRWRIEDGDEKTLPTMNTDITLEYDGKTLIIDTKYYNKILIANPLHNKLTIHAGNMYQIFSYVMNEAAQSNSSVSGLLLYAKTDEEICPDNSYTILGNRISVKTLDLNQDFPSIQEQLDKIIKDWDSSLEFASG
ncbi:MAG: 5-methylcytosine-specific restriction endonuclease system specificity protein McrC [Clostridia bacterium]|nr:5-methylcytosine-specific restriction endonuclease system specificity protein McrC [Clostridia bacterium]